MINISFSDSLSGSLKAADYRAKKENRDTQDLGDNLYSIFMTLSEGNISGNEYGVERRKVFANMYGRASDEKYRAEWFDETVIKISEIKKLAKKGHKIRIWYSERPDELCAFCWMLYLLDLWRIDDDKIFYVKLPNSILYSDGYYESFWGSAAFEPYMLIQLVNSEKILTKSFKDAHIKQWLKAKEENTQLRTVINGKIVSVYEDFYDSVIKIELQKLEDIFEEATLLGNSISKLCVSDSFIAWRIDEMIKVGMLEIVEEAKKDRAYYCRVLKKA